MKKAMGWLVILAVIFGPGFFLVGPATTFGIMALLALFVIVLYGLTWAILVVCFDDD